MPASVSGLLYVGDPMCSWCWGFAPEIESLAEQWHVEVVVGGLRPGPMAQPLDELASFLAREWSVIAERTGQPFDTSFLDRRGDWVYDTEPAAIAVTQMRLRHPDRALEYFTTVQGAFYAEGCDVTDFGVLAELAGGFQVDVAEFRDAVETDEAKAAAWGDFTRARNWGINGFPTLVGELDDGRLALLARGWTEANVIRERIASIAETVPS